MGSLAARLSDVRGTVHNLAHPDNTVNFSLSSGPLPTRSVMATSTEPGFCVFCHTVHSSSPALPPLWNKDFSVETYLPYSSSSLDALSDMSITQLGQPDDNSKLCLSCHDGTLAVGTVSVFNGVPSLIELIGTRADGSMPGSASSPEDSGITGYTRRLGVDLRNDHPISVNYTMSLARRDGELRDVDSNQRSYDSDVTIGPRSGGGNHKLPLFGAVGVAQVQCPTCHDPHIRDDNPLVGNQKFLRLNRFQEAQPTGLFSAANDIVCLGCHEKGGESWAYSAHANDQVAEQTYYSGPGGLREFPDDLPVWKASCLNCHDTHTVEGARYLLREGTDGTASPVGKIGGNPASEETCFQCHSGATSIVTSAPYSVPDIKSDYGLAIHMPLTTGDQPASPPEEVHDIGGNANVVGTAGPGARRPRGAGRR